MRFTHLVLPLFLTGLGTLPLASQSAHYGVQGALALPGGDLADNAGVGLQVGGHVRLDLGEGHGLMGRLDLTSFGRKDGLNASSFGAAADYTYHFGRNRRGLYVLAGLGLGSYYREFPGGSVNDTALGLDLGAGFDLDRHIGLQARYTSARAGGEDLSAMNLGVTYTF